MEECDVGEHCGYESSLDARLKNLQPSAAHRGIGVTQLHVASSHLLSNRQNVN